MSHGELDKSIEKKINIQLSWIRPNNVPYPNIWKTIKVKSKSGQIYDVNIEDLTADRYEEFLDFMYSNYDCKEPVSRSIDFSSDAESVAAKRAMRRRVLEQKVSLIATLQNDQNDNKNPKITAVLLLVVNSKNDPPRQLTGKKWTLLFNFFVGQVRKGIDPFQLLNSDVYFDDYGVAVAPEYYGMGLGMHMLSCILPMSKVFNIPGDVHVFTSSFSQSIADKLGYKLCKEVSYDDYTDESGKKIFPVEGTSKCMMRKF